MLFSFDVMIRWFKIFNLGLVFPPNDHIHIFASFQAEKPLILIIGLEAEGPKCRLNFNGDFCYFFFPICILGEDLNIWTEVKCFTFLLASEDPRTSLKWVITIRFLVGLIILVFRQTKKD